MSEYTSDHPKTAYGAKQQQEALCRKELPIVSKTTRREEFAKACLTWQPSEDEINRQESIDKVKNPYNEPHKPKLRDRHEIIAQLQLRRADALIAELTKDSP